MTGHVLENPLPMAALSVTGSGSAGTTAAAGIVPWDGPTVAEAGRERSRGVASVTQEGIYLQRLRTWCVSTDPEFAPKAAEIVGLYLNPPLNALVLSVDEKPSIQAIQRASGYVETDTAPWYAQ